MVALALDTASGSISCALKAGDAVYYREEPDEQNAGSLLLPMTEALFEEAHIQPASLNLVVCMRGPGSFTGLRIGFATAKGIAMALGIPLVSVPTLDCFVPVEINREPREPREQFKRILPVLDAKKQQFYAALYEDGVCLRPAFDATLEEVGEMIDANTLITGPGAALLQERLGKPLQIAKDANKGRARELLALGIEAYQKGYVDSPDSAPVYLRLSDAELSIKKTTNSTNRLCRHE